jgi:hypothetical protein
MLAANRDRSNVPPDDLQAAPVRAVPAVTTEGLGKYTAVVGSQPNPAGVTQQHTASQEPRRVPVTVPIQYPQFTIATHAKTGEAGVSASQSDLFAHAKAKPESAAANLHGNVHWQREDHGQTSHIQDDARQQYQAAQNGIGGELS